MAKKQETNIKPLFDNVLIKPLEAQERTESGIILPDNAREKPQVGVVMATGPGRHEDGKLVPVSVKKGQRVMYKKWGGNEVKVGSEEWTMVEEKDILAILD